MTEPRYFVAVQYVQCRD